MLDGPIPGQSLTVEVGNRPWQQPAQYATVEEALQYYIPRLTHPDMLSGLLDTIETGIPLTTIAEAMQTSGAMEGKHNLDVGILVMPVLVETMAYLAEEAGVEYQIDSRKKSMEDEKPSSSAISLALRKLAEKEGIPKEEIIEPVEEEEMPQEEVSKPLGGLMSRGE